MANAVSGQIANGLLGTAFTTSSACASSGHAIGMAWNSVRSGESDLVVTGGAESGIGHIGRVLEERPSMGVMTTHPTGPGGGR